VTGTLPPSASVASASVGGKMWAPAAERNAVALTDLLARHAPPSGRALELASGTGQHVTAFAGRMPALVWQPSEVDADRLASISAYAEEAKLANLRPAIQLDATAGGWSVAQGAWDLIVLINLLHLISAPKARSVITEALAALRPGGCFVLYGPFMRAGQLTSAGDARFHAQLSGADPQIGYKDDTDIHLWLRAAGAKTISVEDMPANNLAFIARL